MSDPSISVSVSALASVLAVIFDWAGTVIDHGCMAPVVAFRAAFAEVDLEISEAEARAPMGAAKREHIVRILAMPDVRGRWQTRFGTASTEASVDDLYERATKRTYSFMPRRTGADFGATVRIGHHRKLSHPSRPRADH